MVMFVDIAVIFLSEGGWKDDGIIHPSIKFKLLTRLLYFFQMKLAVSEPNFYSGWHRAAMIKIVDISYIFLGGGGGKHDGNTSIHPSIVRLGSRIFLRMQLAACELNFYSGWRRAAG